MKMISKKFLGAVGVGMLVLSIGMGVNAAEGAKPEGKGLNALPRLKERLETRGDRLAKRSQLTEELAIKVNEIMEEQDTANENKAINDALREENKALREEIKEILKDRKNSDETISQELNESLKALFEEEKEVLKELKTTKGAIVEQILENEELFINEDYEALEEVFDTIYLIQEERKDLLEEMNDLLEEMLNLL